MRTIILMFLLVISFNISAKTYYVAPIGGSDINPGTISQPWATWQKAFNTAIAGDTVYFRGGVWEPSSTYGGAYVADVLVIAPRATPSIGHNGEPGNPICYFNYPGETPILDCKNVHFAAPSGYGSAIKMENAHWINWRGLTIRNVYQRSEANQDIKGIVMLPGSNMNFERMTVHDIGGCGLLLYSSVGDLPDFEGYNFGWGTYDYIPFDTTTYLNCDIYNCCDTFRILNEVRSPGNSADGFKQISYPGNYISYTNCRSWNNADDGWDGGPATGGYTIMKNCWGFLNGDTITIDEITYYSEGNGIKYVCGNGTNGTIPTFEIQNCIFANNSGIGINNVDYSGYQRASGRIYNNLIYHCSKGLTFGMNNPSQTTLYNIFRNNIIWDMQELDPGGRPAILECGWTLSYTESNNTWDYGEAGTLAPFIYPASDVSVSDLDFVSLDYTQLDNARKADGSLPDITFGTLVSTSDLIDAGIDVGLPYNGTAPDLGYSEYIAGVVVPPTPAFVSAIIENSTPSRLDITYNLTLANIVPVASAFTVIVNSSVRTVNSVAISGSKVLLTLPSPVIYGDVVTLAYTKPATNPLQTSSGGQAVSITAQSVINNCSLTANQPPVITITSPTKSITFTSPATITIEATVSDPDGSINRVEFYNGTTKIGEKISSPYTYTWKDVTEGTYLLTAVATDNSNAKTVSDAVSAVVEKSANAVNQLPVVNITTPKNGKKYKNNDKIIIKAEASDPDGTISKVELKNGGITIAELTTTPYSFILEDMDTGKYVITVVATDNLGASTTSSNLELAVVPYYDVNSEIINLYPNPNNGHFTIDMYSGFIDQINKITIVSFSGKTIYNDILNEQESSREFDLSRIADGTYVLMVSTSDNIVTTKKFIKN